MSSCHMCKHTFEKKQTKGQEWAASFGVLASRKKCPYAILACPLHCPGITCEDCRHVTGPAYDIGYAACQADMEAQS